MYDTEGAVRTQFTLSKSQTKGSCARTVFVNKQLAQQLAFKKVRTRAIELLAEQAELPCSYDETESIPAPCELPHVSHHITQLEGNSEVIWCKVCGHWSQRAKLRNLAVGCEGLKSGLAATMRLLQCGVRPAPKATIPPRLLKKRRKKGRW